MDRNEAIVLVAFIVGMVLLGIFGK